MTNNNLHEHVIIENGSIATARLINRTNRVLKLTIENCTVAIDELLRCLALYTMTNRWHYALSEVLTRIWELAAVDTAHYQHLCNYAYHIHDKSPHIIPYDPDKWGIGTNISRQVNTYELYKNTYGDTLLPSLWMDVLLHISITRITNSRIIINIIREDFNESGYSLLILMPIKRDKKVKDVIYSITQFENTDQSNIMLFYDGSILDDPEAVLDTIFTTDDPIIHLVIRTVQ